MLPVIDAVAERRLHWSVIDKKRGHLDAVGLIDDALANVGRDDFDPAAWVPLICVAPYTDIEHKSFLQMFHHRSGAIRPPYFKGRRPTLRGPRKQIQLG